MKSANYIYHPSWEEHYARIELRCNGYTVTAWNDEIILEHNGVEMQRSANEKLATVYSAEKEEFIAALKIYHALKKRGKLTFFDN